MRLNKRDVVPWLSNHLVLWLYRLHDSTASRWQPYRRLGRLPILSESGKQRISPTLQDTETFLNFWSVTLTFSLLKMLFRLQKLLRVEWDGKTIMNGNWIRSVKEYMVDYHDLKALQTIHHLPIKTTKYHKKSVGIADNPATILLTGYFHNSSVKYGRKNFPKM